MKYEKIGTCEMTLLRNKFGAFDYREDAKTMVRLIKWLCEEVEQLKEDNKQIALKIAWLSFFTENVQKEDTK